MPNYRHLTLNEKKSRFTFAAEYDPETATLNVGVGKAHSKYPFSKKMGRTVAASRLQKKPIKVPVEPEQNLREVYDNFVAEYCQRVKTLHGEYSYKAMQQQFSPQLAIA